MFRSEETWPARKALLSWNRQGSVKEEKETILFGMNGMKGEHWEGETKGPFILDEEGRGTDLNGQSQGEAHEKGKPGRRSWRHQVYEDHSQGDVAMGPECK